ncbi:hypothetical protein C0Q70_04295 [Pomacea canaliculata]|uniref:LRRNT domain-containing protein n=2 Tax=Pomacea canaliculata TaxID=400727 RepID=A0A2T7PV40_POMCA|nr:hypothetical protein C0Q70_04295 [Pomacea canaliculata]
MVASRLTIILGLVIIASSSSRASQSAPAGGSSADLQQLPQDHQSGRTPAVDCYEGMCWCTSETADCSGNFGNLTFIPKFSENITFLKFSHNKLQEIPDEDFFSNVTGLLLLDLGFNDLRNLSHNSFRKLDKLRYLCMNANPLDLADALPVFEIPSLQELEFKFGRVGKFPDDFFASHPLPELQTLDLTDTFREETLDMDLFSPLPRLQRLTLSSNHIRLVRCGRNFTSLTYLDLSMNYIDLFPRTCKNQTSLYPNLEELNLNYNRIENLDNNVCLPSLRILKLNSNVVRHFVSDMFSINSFPCLEVVSVQKMKRSIRTIEDSAFANPVLRSLSLANNELSFAPSPSVKICFPVVPP